MVISDNPENQRGVAHYATLILCAFASLTDVKIGPVQIAELFFLLIIPFYLYSRGLKSLSYFMHGKLNMAYMLFIGIAIFSSVIALLTQPFVLASEVDVFIKRPGWISLSRVTQFLIVFLSFTIIAFECMRSQFTAVRAIRIYVFSAVLSALYGIFGYYLLAIAGIEIGGAYRNDIGNVRLCSFFVEGGPYGLFCLSAILIAINGYKLRIINKRLFYFYIFILAWSLYLAQSKSALAAFSILFALIIIKSNFKFFLKIFPVVAVSFSILVFSTLDVGGFGVLEVLLAHREKLLLAPELIGDDPNITMGRIAGSIIVPEMIVNNPFLGIGLGNYPLLRNSTLYNPNLPAVDLWDAPGLGLAGFAAEVGVLGLIPFVLFFLLPIGHSLKRNVGIIVIAATAFPLIAFVFGVQPTFLYPWIVMALSVGVLSRQSRVQM